MTQHEANDRRTEIGEGDYVAYAGNHTFRGCVVERDGRAVTVESGGETKVYDAHDLLLVSGEDTESGRLTENTEVERLVRALAVDVEQDNDAALYSDADDLLACLNDILGQEADQ